VTTSARLSRWRPSSDWVLVRRAMRPSAVSKKRPMKIASEAL
jgi:hypothetical protein